MTKEIIIIALIALIIYLYYQQNTQPNISDNSQQIKELQNQVQHYQTLYQKRVEKDSIGSEVKEYQHLQTEFKKLEKNVQEKEIQLTKTHQEQLRKINCLFDGNAQNYETIDFNGLFALLSSIAEREREQK